MVVSKLRERQFNPALATEVQSAGDVTIKLQRVQGDSGEGKGEVLLYCHSLARQEKDRAIDTAKASGLEAALIKLQYSTNAPSRRWRAESFCSMASWRASSQSMAAYRSSSVASVKPKSSARVEQCQRLEVASLVSGWTMREAIMASTRSRSRLGVEAITEAKPRRCMAAQTACT